MYPGENTDVGPQRILRLVPRPTYFDALFDSQVIYSDNANYSAQPGAVASVVFVNTVQGAVTSPVYNLGPGSVAAALGFASQWYNYGNNQLEHLDFNTKTVYASGKYTVGKWQVGAGLNLTRFIARILTTRPIRNSCPTWGATSDSHLQDHVFCLGRLRWITI